MHECLHDGEFSCDPGHHERTGLVWEVTHVCVQDVSPSGGDWKVMVLEREDDGFEAPLGGGVHRG